MKVYRVEVRCKDKFGSERTYIYHGIASNEIVAIRQTKRAAKKDEFYCIEIQQVECLGDLDFCTKRR